MDKKKLDYIIIYRDECTYDMWKDYCEATGCWGAEESIKIYFDGSLCEQDGEEE